MLVRDVLAVNEERLQVVCDRNPNKLVEWYNQKDKTLVSTDHYISTPNEMKNHSKISKEVVENFLSV